MIRFIKASILFKESLNLKNVFITNFIVKEYEYYIKL